ncbi:ccr4 associated factor [Pseudocyphellaria aurata]|nr:ccr4 associated factor [Pseudocyphellaria aurata]
MLLPRRVSSCPRRFLTLTTSAPHGPPPPPPPTAHVHLTTRRVIALSGNDSPRFLQGLATANIRTSLSPSQGFYAAFLNAAGRVLHDVFIYPASGQLPKSNFGEQEAGFLIEVDAGEVERLAAHLRRFKLRAKVTVRVPEEGEYGVWGLWGQEPFARSWPNHQIGCEDTRAPGMGRRLILPGGTRPEWENEDDMAAWGPETSVESYKVRRMLSGVAEGQGEILRETALSLESNMDHMGGIDFRKGCYVGQELTIRTRHTGVVRKRILPVQLYPADSELAPPETLTYTPTGLSSSKIADPSSSADHSPLPLPPPGTNIGRVGLKGRSAGKWLGGVGNIGLALCRLETMTDTVLTDGGNNWLPQHEFEASWEEQGEESSGGQSNTRVVKIKAFVPGWHGNTKKNLGTDSPASDPSL